MVCGFLFFFFNERLIKIGCEMCHGSWLMNVCTPMVKRCSLDRVGDEPTNEQTGKGHIFRFSNGVHSLLAKLSSSQRQLQVCAPPAASLNLAWTSAGNYSQALDDFQECLAIQLMHLPPHSRLLAETHYQLGMTFGYTGQYSQAIQHFNSSIKVIESRLGMLSVCHPRDPWLSLIMNAVST